MKNIQTIRISSLIIVALLTGTLSWAGLHEEQTTYSANGVTLQGYVVYNSDLPGKRPAVLVVHEWWGLNDYSRSRAKQLAELGYIALAVDMYGNGKTGENPQEAQQLAMPFYQDPGLAKTRLDAAISKIKKYAQTDPMRIAAIGYCFGGSVLLNSAVLGSDLKGVVSFHGATHAFTNPASTETGRKFNMPIAYNADADKNSWNDMKVFLGDLFGK